MRRNKTYSQQKKYYDDSNDYLTLADLFLYWYDCNSGDTERTIVDTYKECNRECKMQIVNELMDLAYLCDYRPKVQRIIKWLMFIK